MTFAQKKKLAMKNEILDHVEFTRKDIVSQARTCSISFFLAAIHTYIKDGTTKCRIIQHLTLQEYTQLREKFRNLDPVHPIAERLENPDTDPWLLFRYYALTLVHNGPTKQVEVFIQTLPRNISHRKRIGSFRRL